MGMAYLNVLVGQYASTKHGIKQLDLSHSPQNQNALLLIRFCKFAIDRAVLLQI